MSMMWLSMKLAHIEIITVFGFCLACEAVF